MLNQLPAYSPRASRCSKVARQQPLPLTGPPSPATVKGHIAAERDPHCNTTPLTSGLPQVPIACPASTAELRRKMQFQSGLTQAAPPFRANEKLRKRITEKASLRRKFCTSRLQAGRRFAVCPPTSGLRGNACAPPVQGDAQSWPTATLPKSPLGLQPRPCEWRGLSREAGAALLSRYCPGTPARHAGWSQHAIRMLAHREIVPPSPAAAEDQIAARRDRHNSVDKWDPTNGNSLPRCHCNVPKNVF